MVLINEETILQNKLRFLDIVQCIERDGMNKELLVRQLTESDFFTAPASTRYHNAYKGGLCEHCLNVYDNLVKLADIFGLPEHVDNNSLMIVGLFHDMSKMNFYTEEIKNRKVYSDKGSKKDSMGKYDWESYTGYTSKSYKDRLCIGNHESTSAFMVNNFIPLTFEEYASIETHHAGLSYDSCPNVWNDVYTKYKLALLLHLADMVDAYNPEVLGE